MLKSFAPAHRSRTLLLFAAAAVLVGIGWFGVGIDDNPVGILLVSLGGACLALAFLHPIRESARYRRVFVLTLAVLVGLVATAIAMEAIGAALRPPGAPEEGVLGAIGIYVVVLASFVGVPALVVSAIGYWVAIRRERRSGSS